ncbi:MAG: bifunctional nuclease family protein [Deltaproteobacteria bacterium]|nr:bifunctional nuclease family protein [Deltaproteobacteria bacterium]
MLVKVTVAGLTIDPYTNSPIMILKEDQGGRSIPIWIGLLEATAIASELENVKFARPMTHDLLRNIIETFGVQVDKVEVCDLRDNTFFALIHISGGERRVEIDARPSDAIALALRAEAPIFVHEQVFDKSARIDMSGQEAIKDKDAHKWTEVLESLSPEDFGKYKM